MRTVYIKRSVLGEGFLNIRHPVQFCFVFNEMHSKNWIDTNIG